MPIPSSCWITGRLLSREPTTNWSKPAAFTENFTNCSSSTNANYCHGRRPLSSVLLEGVKRLALRDAGDPVPTPAVPLRPHYDRHQVGLAEPVCHQPAHRSTGRVPQ